MKKEPFKKLSRECRDFIRNMLKHNPKDRISAEEALQHKWFEIAD